MASVSIYDVRDVIDISSVEVPDAKVMKMIEHAGVALELETNKEINCYNRFSVNKEFNAHAFQQHKKCHSISDTWRACCRNRVVE